MARKSRKQKEKGVYKENWKFIKENKKYFWFVFVLLILFTLVGYFFPVFFSEQILSLLKKLVQETSGMNFVQLFLFLIENNIYAAFSGMITGIFLGLFPIFTAITNGYVLGFVMNKTAEVVGQGVLLRLLPHGIFELPALILSLGLGIRIGAFVFAKKGKKIEDLKYALENSLKIFLFIVIPLLLIAGVIEAGLMILFG